MNFADASQLWQKALSILRADLSEIRFSTWFGSLKLFNVDNGRMVLYSDDFFIVKHLNEHFMTQLQLVTTQVFGESLDIVVVMKNDLDKYVREMERSLLNPKYTFDSFVVGQSNRFAHAASLAVADDPGKAYNPLFIYGGVGLGKTHLMNAIAHYILMGNPKSNVLFTTSENFTNEVVEAIARKKTPELRNKMRTVDVLMIDDVQFLSNKQATQEEFFHTFNTLFSAHKQIVLSSDRPPHEISSLEDRMKSRFMSGLVVDIQKPDFETRMAILLRVSEAENIDISPGAISYIAERIDTNIRELEGSLIRTNALSKLENCPITQELAERALKNIVRVRDEKRITPERIISEVAKRCQVSPDDILSSRRNRDVVQPRQLAIYLTRELAGMSTTRIGTAFGRDHSTIMHACSKVAADIKSKAAVKQMVAELTQTLREG